MSRRAQSLPPMPIEKPKRRPVVAVICFSWKIFTCVFSHVALVSMVVAYCIAGALIFEHLEADNEKTVKQGIRGMRTNVTDDLWDMTNKKIDYLKEDNWTKWVERRLEHFERDILTAMKTKGWDGNENEHQMQWTFFGALFYSIIVITTIGYGHIAPKTDMGKVITIFYAILGIPLMLLCLSNIGDVMASSFRFLYWRVCCYVCTREPRRSRRLRQNRMSMRQPIRTRSQPPPNMRRSMRVSQRSADSGFITRSEYEQNLVHSFSDPQLRYPSHRYSDRTRGHRPRDDFQYDTYDERSRDRRDRDRDRHSPYVSRKVHSKYDDYNDLCDDRDDRYNERNDERCNDRRRDRLDDRPRDRRCGRDRSPRDDWDDDRDRDRDEGRDRERGRRGHRTSDYGQTLDPYYNPDNSPRNPRRFDREQRFSNRDRNGDRLRDRHTVERERNIKGPNRLDPLADFDQSPSPRRSQSVRSVRGQSATRELNRDYSKTLPNTGRNKGSNASPKARAKSVDPRQMRNSVEPDEYGVVENRYAMLTDNGNTGSRNRRGKQDPKYARSYSMPRHQSNHYSERDRGGDRVDRLEVPEVPLNARRRSLDRDCNDDLDDDFRLLGGRAREDPSFSQTMPQTRRGKQALPPSPRIMSPMGFAIHRQAKFTKSGYDDDYDFYFDDEWDSCTDITPRNRPVPIWLCVFLVVGYIMAGAFLFSEWEHWSFLDSAYFCFITLTTIGFGDFVPAQGVKENSEVSIALCSLYLLFGISLLAMSFNLVQEEVISNVKSVARRLGILKEQENVD